MNIKEQYQEYMNLNIGYVRMTSEQFENLINKHLLSVNYYYED